MRKILIITAISCVFAIAVTLAARRLASQSPAISADQPDGLHLPAGFNATVVSDGIGAIRDLAVRSNGDIYLWVANSKSREFLLHATFPIQECERSQWNPRSTSFQFFQITSAQSNTIDPNGSASDVYCLA